MKRPEIKGTMIVAEVLEKFPEVVDVLFNHGIQCFGCGASTTETLEDGYRGHYGKDADVKEFLKELNEAIVVEVCMGNRVSSYDEPLFKILFRGDDHWVCEQYFSKKCCYEELHKSK